MTAGGLQRSAAHRIVCAVVVAELDRLRESNSAGAWIADWSPEMPIGDEGLGLDSLEQFGALGALAETFDLDDDGLSRDAPRTVGDWVDLVMARQTTDDATITVSTSGSTGTPRPCTHATADLIAEAADFAGRFADRKRVVALVPAHHLYGMIWTALLPGALGVPVYAATIGAPLGLSAGDLVVAVPDQWRALLRLTRQFPADIIGISSAGPLDDAIAAGVLAAGLAQLMDVYGSSETGAIATRMAPMDTYDLLPRWSLGPLGDDDWQLIGANGETADLPDHVARTGERSLRPIGRRDGAVQVGGHNVWPEHVARVLRTVEGVAEVAVRLHANGRLKAFVVPQDSQDPAELGARLEAMVQGRLSSAERPKTVRFGNALPRNALGKLTDWL